MADDHLALQFAVTVRHDGRGGIADDLAEPEGLRQWARARAELLGLPPGAITVDEGVRAAVVEVRTAMRALFARAVRPGEPSRADAGRLPDAEVELARLNAAAARTPVVPRLAWPPDGPPRARLSPVAAGPAADDLAAALARAAIDFLAGPDLPRLRACHAPRCVRYFVQSHPRQQWCKPACGNRARVARHHARTH
jgi:predicted RNA-binding Zn ribbon-like protein